MRPYAFSGAHGVIYQQVELQQFTEEDLKTYLTKRFNQIDAKVNEDKVNVFVDRVIAWLDDADTNMKDVVKLPLLAFLLSDSLIECFKQWLNSKDSQPEGPWDDLHALNLVALYELFIIEQAKRYLKRYLGGENALISVTDQKIIQFSASVLELMGEIAFAELFNGIYVPNHEISQAMYQSLLDFGIITGRVERLSRVKRLIVINLYSKHLKNYLRQFILLPR